MEKAGATHSEQARRTVFVPNALRAYDRATITVESEEAAASMSLCRLAPCYLNEERSRFSPGTHRRRFVAHPRRPTAVLVGAMDSPRMSHDRFMDNSAVGPPHSKTNAAMLWNPQSYPQSHCTALRRSTLISRPSCRERLRSQKNPSKNIYSRPSR